MLAHPRSDSNATRIPFSADRLSPKAFSLSLVPRKLDCFCLGQCHIHLLASFYSATSHRMSSNVEDIQGPAIVGRICGSRC